MIMTEQDARQEEVELWRAEDVVNLVATDPAAAIELLARAPSDELVALMDYLSAPVSTSLANTGGSGNE